MGWGGGQKFSLNRLQAVGKLGAGIPRPSNGNAAGARFSVGGSNPGLLTFSGGGGGVKIRRPGFEPPTRYTPVGCITIRPLLGMQ